MRWALKVEKELHLFRYGTGVHVRMDNVGTLSFCYLLPM